jgi:hypothetical protein
MEHECPICKDSFETEAGLSAHNRSKKHHYNVKMEDKDTQIKQLISLLLSLHPEKKENVELILEKKPVNEEDVERQKIIKKIEKEQLLKRIEKEERDKYVKRDAFERIQKLKVAIESLNDNDIMEFVGTTDVNPFVESWKTNIRTAILCKGLDDMPAMPEPLWMKEFY